MAKPSAADIAEVIGRSTLAVFTVLAALLSSPSAHAKELPACDDPSVGQVLLNVMKIGFQRVWKLPHDLGSGDPNIMRWCEATLELPHGRGNDPFLTTYTLEWINEAEGRWWLQVKTNRLCGPLIENCPR